MFRNPPFTRSVQPRVHGPNRPSAEIHQSVKALVRDGLSVYRVGAGNQVPELVALPGGDSVFGEAGAHSPRIPWDALREADPDHVAARHHDTAWQLL
jgi:hypothetical protein